MDQVITKKQIVMENANPAVQEDSRNLLAQETQANKPILE
jgi:hypothetical protein